MHPDEPIRDPTLELGHEAILHGLLCLRTLVLSIERGDAPIPIDPQAWENTMTALEWMMDQHLTGALHTEPPITQDHLDCARRLHALGSVALTGGQPDPDLVPLADGLLSSWLPGWRSAYSTFPVCYPPPHWEQVEPKA